MEQQRRLGNALRPCRTIECVSLFIAAEEKAAGISAFGLPTRSATAAPSLLCAPPKQRCARVMDKFGRVNQAASALRRMRHHRRRLGNAAGNRVAMPFEQPCVQSAAETSNQRCRHMSINVPPAGERKTILTLYFDTKWANVSTH